MQTAMPTSVAVERFLDVDGMRIRYLEAGEGPPLLLLHGLGQSSTAWLRVIAALSSARRVIAPDLPGFGGTPAPSTTPYGDPDFFVRVIGDIVTRLSIEPCDAVGHSAGGLALLIDASRSLGRYRRLVLVDPAGFTATPDNVLVAAAASLVRLLVAIPRARSVTRALYATAFSDPRCVDEETVDELVRRGDDPVAKTAARRAFEQFFDYCRRLEPFHDMLRGLQTPTLVIWGADDRLFRAGDVRIARRVLPHARIEVFERCGHCPQIECPDRFASTVKEFLSST
jgi:4,5:9,10-diseco-3-hydroxy-5,9,17-trioxoandrosta-1(10),2-diene-4-oate hydrolase